jgi:hypothetical protein
MRILFVADGRSPIALNWISHFVETGHEVILASTFPCQPDLSLASLEVIPVAFAAAAGGGARSSSGLRRLVPVGLRTAVRQRLGPLTLPSAASRLDEVITRLQPELVHALRIPYEGMLAALALAETASPPLVVSVWGNDFTLHASSSPHMRRYTRQALRRADALLADCRRDLRLATEWGFDAAKPAAVLPGGGGVQLDLFYPPQNDSQLPVIINPRGFRAYVQNEAFFHAIPLVLAAHPEARFVCPAMAGEVQAQHWVEQLGIAGSVDLLPHQTPPQMADLFRRSWVAVSPTTHDGTPNTLLEAMACGCFPIAGDLEPLREWITPGENGLLVDPSNPQALAQAIIAALDDPALRLHARQINATLIADRADYRKSMASAEIFYRNQIKKPNPLPPPL